MGPLGHLHGVLASIVIYALLFGDEAGVPIPFAPNEVLLLIGGVLTRTGVISVWVFYPAAAIAMAAGMLTGYGWSRAIGRRGLELVVQRVHAEAVYRRVVARMEAAGPPGIAVARLLPGVRPYATLCAGALGISVRRFLFGAIPALLIWAFGWTTVGVLIGLPAEYYMGRFERLIVRGVLLLAIGAAGYAGLHRLQRQGLTAGRRRVVWLPMTLLITGGAIASMAAGTLAIGRGIAHVHHHAWVDALVAGAVVAAIGGVAAVRDLSAHRRRPAAAA